MGLRTNMANWPIQVSVSLPRKIHDFIAKDAKRLGISKAEYIRQCIVAALVRGSANNEGR